MGQPDLDQLAINTIRFLAADAVQQANSGHPGLPMGAAPMAYVLWTRHLKHSPAGPRWADRDRFVLSAGHGSMLLYALLFLTGYDLSLDDLRTFRQWGSRTPGHPEHDHTPGVEATTGPLGQGISNAVGLAIAEAHLSGRYDRPGHEIVDHHTYVIASDGDLMEGVASEACSLAGHLALGKLIVLYDQNHISLSGSTSLCFTEDVGARFQAYGWQVQHVADGNDLAAIDTAIGAARAARTQPSIILVRTVIGYGAPHKQNTFEAHGSPLGPDELRAAKDNLGWPREPAFLVPRRSRHTSDRGGARRRWSATGTRAAARVSRGASRPGRRAHETPRGRAAGRMGRRSSASRPTPGHRDPQGVGERDAGDGRPAPELVGGSADLNPHLHLAQEGSDFEAATASQDGAQGQVGGPWGPIGRNLHFGVREHAMGRR